MSDLKTVPDSVHIFSLALLKECLLKCNKIIYALNAGYLKNHYTGACFKSEQTFFHL